MWLAYGLRLQAALASVAAAVAAAVAGFAATFEPTRQGAFGQLSG